MAFIVTQEFFGEAVFVLSHARTGDFWYFLLSELGKSNFSRLHLRCSENETQTTFPKPCNTFSDVWNEKWDYGSRRRRAPGEKVQIYANELRPARGCQCFSFCLSASQNDNVDTQSIHAIGQREIFRAKPMRMQIFGHLLALTEWDWQPSFGAQRFHIIHNLIIWFCVAASAHKLKKSGANRPDGGRFAVCVLT